MINFLKTFFRNKTNSAKTKETSEVDSDLRYKLFDTIKEGNIDEFKTLFNQGIDVNSKVLGKTLLMEASLWTKLECWEMVKILLDNGAGVDLTDQDGQTALMYAMFFSNWQVAELLLQNGANINAKSKYGVTAYSVAVERGNTESASRLLGHGANPELVEGEGLRT